MLVLRFNLLIIILFAALVFLQYKLWFEKDGARDMLHLKKMLTEQNVEMEKLKQRNAELLFQVQRLKNGHDAAEERARNELGMIKKGETFYQVVK